MLDIIKIAPPPAYTEFRATELRGDKKNKDNIVIIETQKARAGKSLLNLLRKN
jgi:hypothetical protein